MNDSPDPGSPFQSLKLSHLPKRQCGVLRNPTSTRPALRLVDEKGSRAVVKDYSTHRFLFRNTVGRFLIWREKKALDRLKGIAGIPRCYRVIDGLALVMEEIPARDVEGMKGEERLPGFFFDELGSLVSRVHRHGMAHCDLKRAPNILVDMDKRPYIVDWSASINEREFAFFPLTLIYRRFVMDDLNGIVKLRLKHCPETVTLEETKQYLHRSRSERCIRALRDKLRELLQRMA